MLCCSVIYHESDAKRNTGRKEYFKALKKKIFKQKFYMKKTTNLYLESLKTTDRDLFSSSFVNIPVLVLANSAQ